MSKWHKNFYLIAIVISVAVIHDFDYNQFLKSDENILKTQKTTKIIIDFKNETDFESKSSPIAFNNENFQLKPCETQIIKAKFWCHHIDGDYQLFKNVKRVLNILDMEEIQMNLTSVESTHQNWDLLWAYQFHNLFDLPVEWSQLKKHQKINHIPGNHYMASKSLFGTTTNSKYVPKAFTDLNQLKEYATKNPSKKFVTKFKSNRGVQLKNVSEINFIDTKQNTVGEFAQEFIDNPLLWDGHKFDIGIHVVITSVNPLRLYYLTSEIVLRVCGKPYNVHDQSSYAISDTRLEPHEFSASGKFFNNDYTNRDAVENFLTQINANISDIWWQIEDAIRSIVISKEKHFIEWIEKFQTTKRNHFEMFRFDMILDDEFNIHIMEINQHPGVYASDRFLRYEYLFENALYNLFNIVGVGTNYRKENFEIPSPEIESIVANKKHLQVRSDICLSDACKNSCLNDCAVCWNCLNQKQRDDRIDAYREQLNVGDWKRLFPPKADFLKSNDEQFKDVLYESKLHLEWFTEMCKKNQRFC